MFSRLSVISNWTRLVFGHLKKFFRPFGYQKKNSGHFRSYIFATYDLWLPITKDVNTMLTRCWHDVSLSFSKLLRENYLNFGFGLVSVMKSDFGHFRSFPIFVSVRFRSYKNSVVPPFSVGPVIHRPSTSENELFLENLFCTALLFIYK